jgi:hypothetical protein
MAAMEESKASYAVHQTTQHEVNISTEKENCARCEKQTLQFIPYQVELKLKNGAIFCQ